MNDSQPDEIITLASCGVILLVVFFLLAVNQPSQLSVYAQRSASSQSNQQTDPFSTFGQFLNQPQPVNNQTTPPGTNQPNQTQDLQNIQQKIPEGVKVINLNPVGNAKGSGTAIIATNDNNLAIAIETALADPPASQFYFAWLETVTTKEPVGFFRSLGKLNKIGGNYLLSATQQGSLSDFSKIKITLETKDDETLETNILEGSI